MKDGRFESAKEMMQALIDGKKIKLSGTSRNLAMRKLDNYGNVVDSEGRIVNLNFALPPRDYELYQEPKKLKKVKLLGWIDACNGLTITRFEEIKMNPEYYKRCPSLDKEVDVEE